MSQRNSGLTESAVGRFDELVADYVRGEENGQTPDRERLLNDNPDLADELTEFFRNRDRMQQLLDPLRSAAARVLNIRCPECHHSIEFSEGDGFSNVKCLACGACFSLVDDTLETSEGQKRVGHFRLIKQVGVGQFGTVWQAEDLALERIVAIKIPRRGCLDAEDAEWFLRDARLAAQLQHPNIVAVHEVGKDGSTIFIVSNFIEGSSLKETLKVGGYSCFEAARLCAAVADALQHAHQAGVVHRDLKPANVMIDMQGAPHLVDFGLAKKDRGEVTMTLEGQVLGTPAYMSPEQARGDSHHVDARTDIYSLGVILFELLTGVLPFRGEPKMLIVQILNDEPPSLRYLKSTVPRDLETICLKCLEKDPVKRYATAQEAADDLRRFLRQEPINARAVGTLGRGARWCRRNTRVALLSASILVLLAVAAVVSPIVAYQQSWLKGERQRALAAQQQAIQDARDASILALLHARTEEIPQVLRNLSLYGEQVKPHVEAKLAGGQLDDAGGLRFQLAGLLFSTEPFQYLCNRACSRHVSPDELKMICQVLMEFCPRESLASELGELWDNVLDEHAETRIQMQVACLLAALDADSPNWTLVADDLANFLATQSPIENSNWIGMLQPVATYIRTPLEEIFLSTTSDDDRAAVSTAWVSLMGDELDSIAELIKLSKPAVLSWIIHGLRSRQIDLIPRLAKELRESHAITAAEQVVIPKWELPLDLGKKLKAASGFISQQAIICLALPLAEFDAVCEGLRPGNYRPIRCRPYRSEKQLLVAAIWTRDRTAWKHRMGLSPSEVQGLTDLAQSDGYWPTDLAGYVDENGNWNCQVIWHEEASPRGEVRLSPVLSIDQWQGNVDELKTILAPVTVQVFHGPDGEIRRSIIWRANTQVPWSSLRSRLTARSVATLTTDRPISDLVTYDYPNSVPYYGAIRNRDSHTEYRTAVGSKLHDLLELCKEYDRQGFRPQSISVLPIGSDSTMEASCVWHRAVRSEEIELREQSAKANLAIVLFHLGQDEGMLELLGSKAGSQVRSELILRFAETHADAQRILDLLSRDDLMPEVEQALLLALAQYPNRALPDSRLPALRSDLMRRFHERRHPGVHAAVGLLYERWFGPAPVPERSVTQDGNEVPDWYVTSKGQTMAVIPIPFSSGKFDTRVDPDLTILAVDTRELTAKQIDFREFPRGDETRKQDLLKARPEIQLPEDIRKRIPFYGDSSKYQYKPLALASWYDAVAYCQLLNELEGIPESEWCYLPNADGRFATGMRIASDFWSRTGYRLLSESEWTYVAMAGSDSAFYFGGDANLLKYFAWYSGNSWHRPAPTGQLMPNLYGLFDMHGNLAEWCHDSDSQDDQMRTVMGGHCAQLGWQLSHQLGKSMRSASTRHSSIGIRVGRSLVPTARDAFSNVERMGRSGRWRDAWLELNVALRRRPNDWLYRCLQARLSAFLGEHEVYREQCRRLVEQFFSPTDSPFTGEGTDAAIAHEIVIACVAMPDTFQDWSPVVKLGELAQVRGHSGVRSLAAALYRSGEIEKASKLLDDLATFDEGTGRIYGDLFRAMAHRRLGEIEKSDQAFEMAANSMEAFTQLGSAGDYGSRWRAWPICTLVQQEFVALQSSDR
ncbi:MAG: protein kinase [Planctomycetales bacterium]|nr:protein kinase [Planctomycetales bacterium]